MFNCLECVHFIRWSDDDNVICDGQKNLSFEDNEIHCESFTPAADPINHPRHYESGQYECFDVMIETQGKDAVMDFCICNAFKYIYRFRNKGGDEDIKKANWYLSRYLELREKE